MKRMVSGITLTLLLIGVLTLAFNIQPVKASGTIYIRADGSIDPPTAPISSVDNVTYTLTGNITSDAAGIAVERDNIVVDGAGYTIQGTEYERGMQTHNRNNVTIQNINIRNFDEGISLYASSRNVISGNNLMNNDKSITIDFSSNNTVFNNRVTNGSYGIRVAGSSNNNIQGNNVTKYEQVGMLVTGGNTNIIRDNNLVEFGTWGIHLYESSNNTIVGNNVVASNLTCGIYLERSQYNTILYNNVTKNFDYGLLVMGSSNNIIFRNRFTDNKGDPDAPQAYELVDSTNIWDNGYPFGGNYWSDYTGEDLYSGPYQNESGSDGIGDTPYLIYPGYGGQDNYPLAESPTPDAAVTNVTTSKSGCLGVGNGSPYPVLCQGRTAKVYVTVENQGNFTELFEVSAYCNESAIPIHEQWPTLEQSETFWTMGDVNKDGYIDVCDAYLIEANYGWTGPPGENPADIDEDGDVDVYDMVICVANYGLDIWTHFTLSPDIGEATLVNLPNGSSTTITFRWNATGWAKGNYTIKAIADQVAGEIDLGDNTFINGWIMVVHPGDLDNSCEVDITDVVMVTAIYRVKIGDPDYNACRDVVEDCMIDISDVVAVTAHYRESW